MVLMIWDLIFSDHGYFVFQHEQQTKQALQHEIEKSRVEKEKLKHDIIDLRENPKTLEEVIHRELGYVYPDEYMMIMPEETPEKPEQQAKKRNEDE